MLILMLLLIACQKKQVEEVKEKNEEKTTSLLENGKFSLEYPKEWGKKESDGMFILLPTGKEELNIIVKHEVVEKEVTNDDLKAFFERISESFEEAEKKTKEIKIDDKNGYETSVSFKSVEEDGSKTEQIIISRYVVVDGNLYLFEVGGKSQVYSDNKEKIEAAYSTFKIK